MRLPLIAADVTPPVEIRTSFRDQDSGGRGACYDSCAGLLLRNGRNARRCLVEIHPNSEEMPVAAGPRSRVAAYDLGSNSFHLLVAEADGQGGLRLLEQAQEMVRLGAESLRDGIIPKTASRAAWRLCASCAAWLIGISPRPRWPSPPAPSVRRATGPSS